MNAALLNPRKQWSVMGIPIITAIRFGYIKTVYPDYAVLSSLALQGIGTTGSLPKDAWGTCTQGFDGPMQVLATRRFSQYTLYPRRSEAL